MRFIILFSFVFSSLILQAQELTVKGFEILDDDESELISRMDINGVKCGLVKVEMNVGGAQFEGNIIGDVEYKNGFYFVYMADKSKRLIIKHNDILPTTVVFSDYDLKYIQSGSTYQLKTKVGRKKVEKLGKTELVRFKIFPQTARLFIDGNVVYRQSGGEFSVNLSLGSHFYTVTDGAFSINNVALFVEKDVPLYREVNLMDYSGSICVNCRDSDASIVINGEPVGVGSWKGTVIPGSYSIEISKAKCKSQRRVITVSEGKTETVVFPLLPIKAGALSVNYYPEGTDVYLDGKFVGKTPLRLDTVLVGEYKMSLWKKMYEWKTIDIEIGEGQKLEENGEMKLTNYAKYLLGCDDYHMWGICERNCLILTNDSFVVNINPVAYVHKMRQYHEEYGADFSYFYPCKCGKCRYDDDIALALCKAKEYGEDSYTLCWFYYYGIGVEQDKDKARKLLEGKRDSPAHGLYKIILDLKPTNLEEELIEARKIRYFYDFDTDDLDWYYENFTNVIENEY